MRLFLHVDSRRSDFYSQNEASALTCSKSKMADDEDDKPRRTALRGLDGGRRGTRRDPEQHRVISETWVLGVPEFLPVVAPDDVAYADRVARLLDRERTGPRIPPLRPRYQSRFARSDATCSKFPPENRKHARRIVRRRSRRASVEEAHDAPPVMNSVDRSASRIAADRDSRGALR